MSITNIQSIQVNTKFGPAQCKVIPVGTARDGAATYIELESTLKKQFSELCVKELPDKAIRGTYAYAEVEVSFGEEVVIDFGECNASADSKMAAANPYRTAVNRATTRALTKLFELPPAELPQNAVQTQPAKPAWGNNASAAKPAGTWGNQQTPAQPQKPNPAWGNAAPAAKPAGTWGNQQTPAQSQKPKPVWGNAASAAKPAGTWGNQQTPAQTQHAKPVWGNAAPAPASAPVATNPAENRPWSVPQSQPSAYQAVQPANNQPAQSSPSGIVITVGPFAGQALEELTASDGGQAWLDDFIGRDPQTQEEYDLRESILGFMGE